MAFNFDEDAVGRIEGNTRADLDRGGAKQRDGMFCRTPVAGEQCGSVRAARRNRLPAGNQETRAVARTGAGAGAKMQ